jgi:hypothetical protein
MISVLLPLANTIPVERTLSTVKSRIAIQNLARLMRPLGEMNKLTNFIACSRVEAAMGI